MAKARITAIGQWNGVPAFEYEVAGEVDHVLIHPFEGESYDDLVGFLRDHFLIHRAYKSEIGRKPSAPPSRLVNRTPLAIKDEMPEARHLVEVEVTRTEALARKQVEDGG